MRAAEEDGVSEPPMGAPYKNRSTGMVLFGILELLIARGCLSMLALAGFGIAGRRPGLLTVTNGRKGRPARVLNSPRGLAPNATRRRSPARRLSLNPA